MADLVNCFLAAKEAKRDCGEIVQRTWDDYFAVCAKVVRSIGNVPLANIQPSDLAKLRKTFAVSKKGARSLTSVANDVNRTRVLFKFAHDEGLIDRPIRYGQSFDKPSRSALRRVKKKLMFTAEEIRAMLGAARPTLRAMICLGINGGLGNSDVALLTESHFEFSGWWTWLNYPRPKTGIHRRIPLWPETLAAVREVRSGTERVFLTARGRTWERTKDDDPVSKATVKLLKELGFHREGLSFYTLRRTFQTIADEADRPVATSHIMGHAKNDMPSVYRQMVSDDKLIEVVTVVRDWLDLQA